jgi:carbamoyl-phosphate synthase small subunit
VSEAYLLLEDGRSFPGADAGPPGLAIAEVVFTTAMTGYQEALTDPSFAAQILTFTAPMIGNYGVEDGVGESDGVQAAALVCRAARNAAPLGRTGLLDGLAQRGVPAIEENDTRALVRHLRERGAMLGAVVTDGTSAAEVAERIAAAPQMTGQDLTGGVSRPRRELEAVGDERCRVTLIDYGAKDSIARLLAEAGAHVTVLPHDATAEDVRASEPDGILLANGPGDPGAMDAHVARIAAMLELERPLFGICLGPQLLARALGMETFKLRFGHRGANHPVLERETGRVLVTSQNHGFAVAMPDAPGGVEVTHTSLYDGTVEGLRLPDRPVWSMQFHPEAAPGPHDARDALVAFVDRACAAARRAA